MENIRRRSLHCVNRSMISTILLIFFGSVIVTESASFVLPSRNKPLRQQPILQQQLSPKWQPFTQVISDVDDTIKSSGGVKIGDVALGGIDTQYERGEFYPGVFEFMLHLSLHLIDDSRKPAKVAILTARAEELKAALELTPDSKIGTMLRQTGENHGVVDWGLGPVFYGSVAEWVLQDRKGMRKVFKYILFTSFLCSCSCFFLQQMIRSDSACLFAPNIPVFKL